MMSIEQLAKLVEALPETQTLDLYRLEYAIQSLSSEPRRTLAIRTRVDLGMTVRLFNAIDGNHLSGQIVAMHDVDLSIKVPAENRRYTGRASRTPHHMCRFQAHAMEEHDEIYNLISLPRMRMLLEFFRGKETR